MTAHRTLRVFVDELAIEDGAIPPPRVGVVSHFGLSFAEAVPDGYPPTTVRAALDPDPPPPHGRPHGFSWSGLLRGDGWIASWSGERPQLGRVELTGWFRHMYDDYRGSVRGRVSRIRVMTMQYRASNHTPARWEPTPGWGIRIGPDVDAAPRFFERDALFNLPEHAGATYDGPIGVVIDLDLDDVPMLSPRPRMVPGDVSACDDEVWVLDRELPLLVHLDANHVATEHLLPGAIVYVFKRVHATPTGCWVAGAEGVYRCTVGEPAYMVDREPVSSSEVIGEALLACRSSGSWTLHTPSGPPVAVPAPAGEVSSVTERDGQFLAVVISTFCNADSCTEYRLVQVSTDAGVVTGPLCSSTSGSPAAPVLGGVPATVLAGSEFFSVQEDLSTVGVRSSGHMHLGGGRAGRYIWTVRHPGDRPGCTGRWTEASPDADPVPRQFWVLELLDPCTLELERAAPVFTSQPSVSVDGAGNVWIVGDGLRVMGEMSMELPRVIDVPTILGNQ